MPEPRTVPPEVEARTQAAVDAYEIVADLQDQFVNGGERGDLSGQPASWGDKRGENYHRQYASLDGPLGESVGVRLIRTDTTDPDPENHSDAYQAPLTVAEFMDGNTIDPALTAKGSGYEAGGNGFWIDYWTQDDAGDWWHAVIGLHYEEGTVLVEWQEAPDESTPGRVANRTMRRKWTPEQRERNKKRREKWKLKRRERRERRQERRAGRS